MLVVEVHPGVRDAIREEGMVCPLARQRLVANKKIFRSMGALQESTIARLRETTFARRMYGSPSTSAPIGRATPSPTNRPTSVGCK